MIASLMLANIRESIRDISHSKFEYHGFNPFKGSIYVDGCTNPDLAHTVLVIYSSPE